MMARKVERALNEEQLEQVQELLKGFNEYQVFEIISGLRTCNANVAIYANTKYRDNQMRQIRFGLEKGLDVSHYADPKFKWKQMCQIREGLESGVDVSIYADPKFSELQMNAIRIGLVKGLDAASYADPEIGSFEMKQIRESMEEAASK